MAAPISIRLTLEEDARFLELAESPQVHPKIRRWAQMVRLAGQGWAVLDVLKRFLQEGTSGLVYRKPSEAEAKFTPEMEAFLRTCLAEDRAWTIPQLQEAVEGAFGVRLGRTTLHHQLLR
ncbi:helix-turn-helix domain-containing protein [Thermus tengchongensis]|uniref:Helix-turn-helix domain-containing protein n=1 Tax=Thermus tengchongensis TaxID=1214928 RepID=A0A4Y9F8P9_9DEIN|nr:helix-turn-helix domain-containing protein [Thermus tengchongensis]TFU25202.1 helix-turn-helix domain-containing protein [Thermus tengchongensis]